MTKFAFAAVLAAGAALTAAPSAAHAQFPSPVRNPFSFGGSGGLTVPTGALSNDVNAGYTVAGMVEYRPAPGPLSLRLEVGYDRFDYKGDYQTSAAQLLGVNYSSNTHFIRGNANLVYRFSSLSGIRPYVTGGVGIYNNSDGSTIQYGGSTQSYNSSSTTKFGVNGGVGIEVPLSGITVFGEVRAHGVQTDYTPVTYIPITVGFRF